jgi:hypothetical protein
MINIAMGCMVNKQSNSDRLKHSLGVVEYDCIKGGNRGIIATSYAASAAH